jgi:signal transduction histidine kinase
MRYHCLVPLTAAVANLLICALVVRQGLRDRLHRAFAWMALTIVSWNLAIFSLYYFTDPADAEWWSRVFRVGICLAPVATFHFALTLSESRGALWRVLLGAGYGLAALLVVADLCGLLVSGVRPHIWGWYIVPTPLYGALTASIVVFLLLWAERVWRSYRRPASPRQRVQAKFWLLAGLIQIPFVLTNLLPLYGFNAYPLGDVGNVVFTGIVAYAIARHRLMDVDYVVRKGVSFVLAVAVVFVPGGIGLTILERALRERTDDSVVLVCAALALALVAVVLVPTLQEALETRVHRALFPNLYDYRRRLRELAAGLVHIFDQDELARRLGSALAEILDVEGCQVFLRDEQTRRLALAHPPPDANAEPLPDRLASVLETLVEPMLGVEIEAAHPAVAGLVGPRGWEVVVPLRINDRLIGLVALARNRDFRIFSAEDLELLAAVAGSATVAVDNARLSQQLRRSEAVLERANRLSSLGTLAGGIAHEIRNPLVAVKTFLDLLPERLHDQEFVVNFRSLSLSELQRVTKLISDLLSLGKSPTAGRHVVALAEALEPVMRLMESTAHKRGLELVERVEPGLPSILADADQLKQIALNLLLNAIEVSPAGGKVRLEIKSEPGTERAVVLEVHDEGPGIPRAQLENIFLPFYTTKDTGTGLGLTLAHQMVVEHGGEITVDSTPGRGTVFRVRFPAARAELAGTGT